MNVLTVSGDHNQRNSPTKVPTSTPIKPTEVQAEILAAAATLQLSQEQFRQLLDEEGEQVYREALSRFVSADFEPRWWWEYLRDPQASYQSKDADSFDIIPRLVPNADASIYFVAEDIEALFYPVYRTTTRIAVSVLGECFGYEYYIFPPDFAWLVGENHHDCIFGAGEPIVRAINSFSNVARNS